jgi:hypothetical protein
MKNVFDILRHKEIELRRLQEEVEALRIAARLLADEHDQPPATLSGKPSQVHMIRMVLDEKRQPMHVSEISTAIEKKFRVKIKPAYIGPVIHRQLGKVFFKSDRPNTFGLLTWTIEKPGTTNGGAILRPPLIGGP